MLTQTEEESTLRKKGANGKKKKAKRKKWREAKSQAKARNRASDLLQSETPPNSPAAAETPENQRELGPSRLDHLKFS